MPSHQILVTGGAGFIGSHLSEKLLQQGHHVTIVDDQSTGTIKNLQTFADHQNLTWIAGTVADKELIAELISKSDRVYHLAAAVGVALIAKQPIETIERNIEPTQFLLSELNRNFKAGREIKAFIASTSEVYGKNPKPVWNEEDDLVFGPTTRARWSYGASKAIDEFLALGHYRQDQLPVVVGRFFNVVGPRQTGAYGMVLPRFVDAALAGKPLMVHDDGKQTRCFGHIKDVVGAVTTLMETDSAIGRIYNIGSDQPISILELAEIVKEETGSDSEIVFQSYADAYDSDFEDIRRRVPDLTRLKEAIGYEAQHNLRDIVRDVIESKKN